MKKFWGGRFSSDTDREVERFTESVSFDRELYDVDIRCSTAHAQMLGRIGLLSEKECADIVDGLDAVRTEIAEGRFEFSTAHEDIHTNIEAALMEKIGDTAKKLHTGRSRNDQVAVDLRLWIRENSEELLRRLKALQAALCRLGKRFDDIILPGCTHLQHAQPVLLPHYMLAYVQQFERDRQRVSDCVKRLNKSPLGSGAIAGSTIALERKTVSEMLGFDDITENSLDSVSDRDFLVEYIFCLSLSAMHMSRLCEELIIWNSPEFGFIRIGDDFCTGSSMMPQKKNPDVAELIRGKTGRVYGALFSILTILKGIPMAYNRDMQEDKEALFDASATVLASLSVLARMMDSVEFVPHNIDPLLQEGYLEATALAEYLVKHDIPFREAHKITGEIVAFAEKKEQHLSDCTLKDLQGFSSKIGKDVFAVLTPRGYLNSLVTEGSSAPEKVRAKLDEWLQKTSGKN